MRINTGQHTLGERRRSQCYFCIRLLSNKYNRIIDMIEWIVPILFTHSIFLPMVLNEHIWV